MEPTNPTISVTETVIENKSFWKTHFEQFKLSKLSRAKYARIHNLVKHRFIYWVAKFEATEKELTPQKRADFIPVTISPSRHVIPDKNTPVLCTLQLPNNTQLFVHSETALRVCLEIWR